MRAVWQQIGHPPACASTQNPLQQMSPFAAKQPGVFSSCAGLVSQTPAMQVAIWQVGGVGQFAGVKHATQTPLALQNGVPLGQSTHRTPPMPQVSFPLVWQVPTFPGPLEQQPLGQLAAVQTQSPLTQAFPVGHAVHCSPPVPQVVLELVWHVPATPGPFEQHPLGQLAAVQTQSPLTHALPGGQAVHCSPPMPQVVFELVWQIPATPGPLEQQPLGQLTAVQRQSPLTHALPGGHAVHCSPPMPQVVFVLV
jgi:hypothetical protein